MKVTIFKDIHDSKNPYYIDIDKIVERIKTGNSRELCNKIRSSFVKEERLEYKKKLPSICFSGIFERRANDAIKEHTGLVCIDFDHIEDVQAFKEQMIKDKFIMIAFVSPSGDGLKVVIKIPANIQTHKASCRALVDYLKNDKLDNFEDVARVCFESYDKDIYYNPGSEVFKTLLHEEIRQISKPVNNSIEIFNRLLKWMDNKGFFYTDGNKHKYLVKLAAGLNRFGISKYEAINLLISQFKNLASPVKEKDFETIVNNVYRNYSGHFNQSYFEGEISYERLTRKETSQDIFTEYELKTDTENLNKKLLEHYIDPTIEIPKQPVIVAIRNEYDSKEIPIMTLGNISVIKGAQKSKKTFLQSMFASSLVKNFEIFRQIVPTLPGNKRNVVIIDTEQSKYDTLRLAKRVLKMAHMPDDHFSAFNFRGLFGHEIIELLNYIVENIPDIGIVIIDQVADMVKSLNDENEAVKVVKILEKISAEKNIHICCIVHVNKMNDFAQGWLGTQLMKKAETIINVKRDDKVRRLGIVEPDLSRGEDFEPFIFQINENGYPEMINRNENIEDGPIL